MSTITPVQSQSPGFAEQMKTTMKERLAELVEKTTQRMANERKQIQMMITDKGKQIDIQG